MTSFGVTSINTNRDEIDYVFFHPRTYLLFIHEITPEKTSKPSDYTKNHNMGYWFQPI